MHNLNNQGSAYYAVGMPPRYTTDPPRYVNKSPLYERQISVWRFFYKATFALVLYFSLTVAMALLVQDVDHKAFHHGPGNYPSWHPWTKPLLGSDPTYLFIGFFLAALPGLLLYLVLGCCTEIFIEVWNCNACRDCNGCDGGAGNNCSSSNGDGEEGMMILFCLVGAILGPITALWFYYWVVGHLVDRCTGEYSRSRRAYGS